MGVGVGGGFERRHAGSSAIDWPTGVSKHCRSRPPITQHTPSSSEMCPSGTYHRNRDPPPANPPPAAVDPTQPHTPPAPLVSSSRRPRRELFQPSRRHLRRFLPPTSAGEGEEKKKRLRSELRCFAVIVLIGCGTWNYLGPSCPVVTCACVVRKQGRTVKFNSRWGRVG